MGLGNHRGVFDCMNFGFMCMTYEFSIAKDCLLVFSKHTKKNVSPEYIFMK